MARRPYLLFFLIAVSEQATLLTNPCPPLLGGGFPPSTNPPKSHAISAARSSFATVLNTSISTGSTPYGNLDSLTSSFSINVFSAHEDSSLFKYHYAAPGLNKSLTSGTLNDDTIRKIGSVSKLLTMHTFLIGAGDAVLQDPVSKYVPELRNSHNPDPVLGFNWDEITVGSVAGHLAGMVKDINIQDLSTLGIDVGAAGFPPLNTSEIPKCEANPLQLPCSRKEFFKILSGVTPVGLPFHTPEYSNTAYLLLAYIFEGVTGKTLEAAFEEQISKPLNLTRTSYHPTPANTSNAIIPGDPLTSTWTWDLGDASSAGAMYSTASDLVKIGRSILRSQFLSPTVTRRWMKPTSHTANPYFSIGLVWEITRFDIPISSNDSSVMRTVDLYTKTGNMGHYTAVVVLDPEHDFGFTILLAGSDGPNQLAILSELVAKTWVAAFAEAAREEAAKNLVGTYRVSGQSLNTSIAISLSPNAGGLIVSSYTSNSTNMIAALSSIVQSNLTKEQKLSISLYRTGLRSAEQVAFRAIFEALPQEKIADRFSQNCASWGKVETRIYGNIGLDDFVFEIGKDGKATAVSPRALRRKLTRL